LIERGRQLAKELGETPEKHRSFVLSLIPRVETGATRLKIDISQVRLTALLDSNHMETSRDHAIGASDPVLTLTTPIQLTRVGEQMKLLVEDADDNREPDMGLLRVLARAYDVQRRLCDDPSLTVREIARQEQITSNYLYVVLRLRWLAPDIVTAIVNGRQPRQLTTKRLMRLMATLPADWAAQRALLGFRWET
jgi:hypothetical protein